MSARFAFTGFLQLLTVALVTAAAAAVVLLVKSSLVGTWTGLGVHARLVVGLLAPLAVVVFGLLVEKVERTIRRLAPRPL